MTAMHIFHIAEKSRWDAARLAGSYAQSTLDRSLEDEGFLHAAREDQWEDVRRRYYADFPDPLVLLVIDTDKLTSPWQEDVVGDTTYPHVYGPLNIGAVVATVPLGQPTPSEAPEAPETLEEEAAAPSPQRTFFQEFFGEVAFRMIAAIVVMAAAFAVGTAAGWLGGDWAGLVGLLLALAAGSVVAIAVARRRDRRIRESHA
jgi:uncharacterized protein (DUF952 family)